MQNNNVKFKNLEEVLDKKAKNELLKIARETLTSSLSGKGKPFFDIKNPFLKKRRGVFVTLQKRGNLRGCIGHLEPTKPLWEEVHDLVIQSACFDPRFETVSFEELDKIKIEISVLTVPRKISDISEIVLEKHGVIVEKNGQKGVFLPQVAKETGWDKQTFLANLCQGKAGLTPEAWKNKETKLFTFEAEVFQEQ